MTAAQAAQVAGQVVTATRKFLTLRSKEDRDWLLVMLRQQYPQYTERQLSELATTELKYEAEFRRKVILRLQQDIPEALKLADPEARAARVKEILDREKRYLAMRQEAMADRAIAAAERRSVKAASPLGAYWKLSADVQEHTLDCLAMGEKFWPWEVLDFYHPQLHQGCACELLTLEEAQQLGLMGGELPDKKDAITRAREIIKQYGSLHEHLSRQEVAEWVDELTAPEYLWEAQRRIPRGFKGGGEFAPKNPVLNALRKLVPHLRSPSRARRERIGRWTRIEGRAVFVPEGRHFARTLNGRRYVSPPQSTNVYADGKLVSTPFDGRPVGGGGGKLSVPTLRPKTDQQVALDRHHSDAGLQARLQVDHALKRVAKHAPPVQVGAPGAHSVDALESYGFHEVALTDRGSSFVGHYIGPDGSDLKVTFNASSGRVSQVAWTPSAGHDPGLPAPHAPPAGAGEFGSHLESFARRLAAEHGHSPLIGSVLYRDPNEDGLFSDHSGEHQWDGEIHLGRDIAVSITGMASAHAAGTALTDQQRQEVYASYRTGYHEALHAANPISQHDYATLEGQALEELLTEESARIHATRALREQGLHDVLAWVADNPTHHAVLGTYPEWRNAMDALLNRAGIPVEEREPLMLSWKMDVAPHDRFAAIGALLHDRSPEKFPASDAADAVAAALRTAGELGFNHGEFTPTALGETPLGKPQRYRVANGTVAVGSSVIVNDLLDGQPHRAGTVTGIESLHADGIPFTMSVAYDDGRTRGSILPQQIVAVTSETPTLRIRDREIHQGDHIDYDGRSDGKRSHATVNQVLRAGDDTWVIDATTGADSANPGQRVLLTPARVKDVVIHRPEAPASSGDSPETGTQGADSLAVGQGAVGSAASPTSGVEFTRGHVARQAALADIDHTIQSRLDHVQQLSDMHASPPQEWEVGQLEGLGLARQIVQGGGTNADLLAAALSRGPKHGGGDRNEGFQAGMRSAALALEQGGHVDLVGGRAGDWRAKAAHVENPPSRWATEFSPPKGAAAIPGAGLPDGLEVVTRGDKRNGWVEATLDGHELGRMQVQYGVISGLTVRSDVRRRGIASEMLDRAREKWGSVEHDQPLGRTPMGSAFASGKASPATGQPSREQSLTSGLDYYKATMSQAQFVNHRDARVTFAFQNRNAGKPGGRIADYVSAPELQQRLDRFKGGFSDKEISYLSGLERQDGTGPMFRRDYLEWMRGRVLPPVTVHEDASGDLAVATTGPWPVATLWETVVLSQLNDLYFEKYAARHGLKEQDVWAEGDRRLDEKIALLKQHPDIKLAEFGTRRRFSDPWQRHVVERLRAEVPGNLIGTSNVRLAEDLGLPPIGSYAHEMDMVYAGMADRVGGDLPGAHTQMMDDWRSLYGGNASIALTDTFTTKFFFDSLTTEQGQQWQGLRHDSGDPFAFGEAAVAWYEAHGIDPKGKTLLFTDALDVPTMVALNDRFKGRTQLAFGVGTNLTNDVGVPPLNVVMKATAVDGHPTVKLSDVAGKHTGPLSKVDEYRLAFGQAIAAERGPGGDVPEPVPPEVSVTGGKQSPATDGWKHLWPPHGVAGTEGAQIDPRIEAVADGIVNKGTDRNVEAYSAFDGTVGDEPLADWLKGRGVDRVAVGGLATDYCVRATALDARKAGFDTWFLPAGSRGIDVAGSDAAVKEMEAAGVKTTGLPADGKGAALIAVDVQGDFLPGGSLAVPSGDQVVPVLVGEAQSGRYGTVVASRDWHPADHLSFAPGKASPPTGNRFDPKKLSDSFEGIQVRSKGGAVRQVRRWKNKIEMKTEGSLNWKSIPAKQKFDGWEVVSGGEPSSQGSLFGALKDTLAKLGGSSEPTEPMPFDVSKAQKGQIVRDKTGNELKITRVDKDEGGQPRTLFLKDTQGEMAIPVASLPPLEFVPKGSKPAPAKWEPKPPTVTDDGQLTTVASAGGWNGAAIAQDAAGERWLLNDWRGNPDRVASELLSNAIYRELGVPVPAAELQTVKGRPAVARRLLEGQKGGPKSGLYVDRPSRGLGRGFMADALVANWDVVGRDHQNLLWPVDATLHDVNGGELEPTRIDLGGTLQMRAGSGRKPFGEVPSEVWSMLGPKGQGFGTIDVTEAEMRAQALTIADRLPDSRIDKLVDGVPFADEKMRDEVRQALKGRVGWMRRFAAGQEQLPKPLAEQEARDELRQGQAGLEPDATQHAALEHYLAKPGEFAPEVSDVWKPGEERLVDLGGAPLEVVPEPDLSGLDEVPVGDPVGPTREQALAYWKKGHSADPQMSAGVIVTEPDGRVWMLEPKGHFGGYSRILPKGRVDEGQSEQQAALRELWEETGLTGKITGLVGDYAGTTTITRYFTAERTGGAPWGGDGKETASVRLVDGQTAMQELGRRDQVAIQDAGVRDVGRDLRSLVQDARTREDITVFVPIDGEAVHEPGDTISRAGFLDATTSQTAAAKKGKLLRVLVPAGSSALYVRGVPGFEKAKGAELLLAGPRLRVVRSEGDVTDAVLL